MSRQRPENADQEEIASLAVQIMERVTKIGAKRSADDIFCERWSRAVSGSQKDYDLFALKAFALVNDEVYDPHSFVMPLDYIAGYPDLFSVEELSIQHITSFWKLYEAMRNSDMTQFQRRMRQVEDEEYAALISVLFEDTSREPLMTKIVESHGVVTAQTMRELLDSYQSSTPLLGDGIL